MAKLEGGFNFVSDIDSQRMMIHVHRGKGAKDRYIGTDFPGFFGVLHT
jgi:hypothetical protein